MIPEKEFKEIIKVMKVTGYHCVLGYSITEHQFFIIAEAAIVGIRKHGFDYYVKHMEHWKSKILIDAK